MFAIASARQGRYLFGLDGCKKKIAYLGVFMVCEDTRQAKCNTCGQTVSHGGGTPKTFNTTNLVQHLKAKHPTEYAHFREKVATDATTMAACKSVRHQIRRKTVYTAGTSMVLMHKRSIDALER